MNVPQFKSIGAILIAIFIVSLSAGVATASLHGEIHSWANLADAVKDGILFAVVAVFGWVGLKSPWSKQVRELFKEESEKETVKPGGEVITEKTTVTASRETDRKEG